MTGLFEHLLNLAGVQAPSTDTTEKWIIAAKFKGAKADVILHALSSNLEHWDKAFFAPFSFDAQGSAERCVLAL